MPHKRRKRCEVVGGLILIGFLLVLTGCGGETPIAPAPAKGKAAPVEKKAVVAPVAEEVKEEVKKAPAKKVAVKKEPAEKKEAVKKAPVKSTGKKAKE